MAATWVGRAVLKSSCPWHGVGGFCSGTLFVWAGVGELPVPGLPALGSFLAPGFSQVPPT
jgi:hypothetical protein